MEILETFRILRPGFKAQLQLADDRTVAVTVDLVLLRSGIVQCRFYGAATLDGVFVNEVLSLHFGDPTGWIKVPVQLTNMVSSLSTQGVCWVVDLHVLPGAIRVQRRDYFRLRNPPVGAALRIGDNADDPFITARARDLGGGGVALEVSPVEVERDAMVTMRLDIPDFGPIPVVGQVRRAVREGLNDTVVAVEFVEIRPAHRDRIVSLVFREQTRRLRTKPP